MKKRWWMLGGLLLAGGGGLWLTAYNAEPVPAVRLQRQNVVATLTVTGEVRADDTVSVSPPVSARIVAMHAQEGDWVRPGQLLVQLNAGFAQAQAVQAAAQAQQAEAALANVTQGTRPEQIRLLQERWKEANQRVVQAEAGLEASQSRAAGALHDAQRFSNLYKEDLVSVQEYETAVVQAKVTKQEVERSQAELKAIRRQRAQAAAQLQEAKNGPTRPEVEIAVAARNAAQANAQAVQAKVSDYQVRASLHGLVIQRLQEPGDLALPGQPILKMVDPKTLQIICAVEEADLAKVRVGDAAYAVLDALPEQALPAHLIRIGSQVNPDNGTIEVRAVLNDWHALQRLRLIPGMTADVNIITARLQNALVLPASAVRSEGVNGIVYVFEGHRLVKRTIRMERLSMENVRVLSGVQPGDWVAATATEALLKKRFVKPVPQGSVPVPPKPSGGMATP